MREGVPGYLAESRRRDNLSLCGMHVWDASANRECQRQFRLCINELGGGPGEIRTHDLCLRRAAIASKISSFGERNRAAIFGEGGEFPRQWRRIGVPVR